MGLGERDPNWIFCMGSLLEAIGYRYCIVNLFWVWVPKCMSYWRQPNQWNSWTHPHNSKSPRSFFVPFVLQGKKKGARQYALDAPQRFAWEPIHTKAGPTARDKPRVGVVLSVHYSTHSHTPPRSRSPTSGSARLGTRLSKASVLSIASLASRRGWAPLTWGLGHDPARHVGIWNPPPPPPRDIMGEKNSRRIGTACAVSLLTAAASFFPTAASLLPGPCSLPAL